MDSSYRDFVYGLNKILLEELPFYFNVVKEKYSYIILMTLFENSLPEDSLVHLFLRKKMYRHKSYEVYIKVGENSSFIFRGYKTPQQFADKIIEFIERRFYNLILQKYN